MCRFESDHRHHSQCSSCIPSLRSFSPICSSLGASDSRQARTVPSMGNLRDRSSSGQQIMRVGVVTTRPSSTRKVASLETGPVPILALFSLDHVLSARSTNRPSHSLKMFKAVKPDSKTCTPRLSVDSGDWACRCCMPGWWSCLRLFSCFFFGFCK